MLTDIAILALVLAACIAAAMLLSWAAPHWVDQLPTTTTTSAAAAVGPVQRRNGVGWYGDSLSRPGVLWDTLGVPSRSGRSPAYPAASEAVRDARGIDPSISRRA